MYTNQQTRELARRFDKAADAMRTLANAEELVARCTPKEGVPASKEDWAEFDQAREQWGIKAGMAKEATEAASAAATAFFKALEEELGS